MAAKRQYLVDIPSPLYHISIPEGLRWTFQVVGKCFVSSIVQRSPQGNQYQVSSLSVNFLIKCIEYNEFISESMV